MRWIWWIAVGVVGLLISYANDGIPEWLVVLALLVLAIVNGIALYRNRREVSHVNACSNDVQTTYHTSSTGRSLHIIGLQMPLAIFLVVSIIGLVREPNWADAKLTLAFLLTLIAMSSLRISQ